jgi:hypothetical protein
MNQGEPSFPLAAQLHRQMQRGTVVARTAVPHPGDNPGTGPLTTR